MTHYTPLTPEELQRERARRAVALDQAASTRHKALIAQLKTAGVTGLRCTACGTLHSVGMVGRACNQELTMPGDLCGCWELSEVRAATSVTTGERAA